MVSITNNWIANKNTCCFKLTRTINHQILAVLPKCFRSNKAETWNNSEWVWNYFMRQLEKSWTNFPLSPFLFNMAHLLPHHFSISSSLSMLPFSQWCHQFQNGISHPPRCLYFLFHSLLLSPYMPMMTQYGIFYLPWPVHCLITYPPY